MNTESGTLKIIGRGLIAEAISCIEVKENTLIIASGVSNSQEKRQSEFDRELNLVRTLFESYKNYTVVYFSTTSIFQAKKSEYIAHKKKIETFIQENASSFNIFRLPQVVGIVNNNTLVSFFVKQIHQKQKIKIQKNAKRNLIAIEDVVRIVEIFLRNQRLKNRIINISAHKNTSVYEIAKKISATLETELIFDLVSGGENYKAPINELHSYLSSSDEIFSENYWEKILLKYVPKILINSVKKIDTI